jgi:hypothetical protein
MPHRFFRSPAWLLGGLALALLAGCQDEQIRSYQAPKDVAVEPPGLRMLAVMVPRGKDNWFFKFFGKKQTVAEHEKEFDAFIDSVHFQDNGDTPLTWKVPRGWRQEAAGGFRYATLRFGPKDEGVEITVSKLGPEASDLRDNLDRWRGQVGLPKLEDDEFKKLSGNIKVDGLPATRVDFIGGALGGPAAPAAAGERPAAGAAFEYDKPARWEARPADVKKGVRRPVVLRVADGGREAEVSAVALPGDGGGLAANVDRWRRQVGLPPAGGDELRKDVRWVDVGGAKVPFADVTGPRAGAGEPQRILGAALRHGGRTWFVTMKGPADLVGKQRDAFEAFVKSIRFGGQGAAHE